MKGLVVGTIVVALVLASAPLSAKQRLALQCTPRVLSSGANLLVEVLGPRDRALRELGVRTPQGKFLFIAFTPENGVNTSHPTISSDDFLAKRSVDLKVSSLIGVDLSSDTAERVFAAPGRYTFVASENLETEDETGANISCTVQYTAINHRSVPNISVRDFRSSPGA